MAVDFAYKQRYRPDGGFLLRNTKLRMSRKLLFLAGMLICFDCHTRFEEQAELREFYKGKPVEAVIDRLRAVLGQPPLEITIFDFKHWTRFGGRLAIENMDRRKPIGRTACELQEVFELLPDAALCFDLGHARQCDASMTEAFLILSKFAGRLVQVHISEVNSASQHDPISHGAKLAFQRIAGMIPGWVPVIIESRVIAAQIPAEAVRAAEALVPGGIA